MPDKRLTEIAADMLAYAQHHPFDPVLSPVKFQRVLGHGMRLTCYLWRGQIILDIERQYRELEAREVPITRHCFRVPRTAKTAPIEPHDGWRGVRITWDATARAEAEPDAQQTTFL